jgi:SAM-dependent methyltransferase
VVQRKAAWDYLRCAACGLVHIEPLPDPIRALSAYDDYLPPGTAAAARWERMMRPVIDRSAGLIEDWSGRRRGRLLDIGCGYGFFMRVMALRGWRVEGIEVSPVGRRHARETLGLPVSGLPVEQQSWPEAHFDVITLFYVIEHLLDPRAMLERVLRWLKPGGLLLLRWPHSTPIVRLLGPFASLLDLYHTPFHLFDFSPASLHALLRQCGYQVLATRSGGFTLPAHPSARLCSLSFGLLAQGLEALYGRRILLPGVSKTTLAVKPPA